MNKQALDKYFVLAKKIDFLQSPQDEKLKKVLGAIEELRSSSSNESHYHFFTAEQALINRDFKKALKHYLMSREIPNIHFFCHRCNALIYRDLKKHKESLSSLKKAISYFSDDKTTLQLIASLKKELNKEERSQDQKIISLHADESISKDSQDKDLVSLVSLKEVDFIKKFQDSRPAYQEQEDQPAQLFLNNDEVEDLDSMFHEEPSYDFEDSDDFSASYNFDFTYDKQNPELDYTKNSELDYENDNELSSSSWENETSFISPTDSEESEERAYLRELDFSVPEESDKLDSPWDGSFEAKPASFTATTPSITTSFSIDEETSSYVKNSFFKYQEQQKKAWEQYHQLHQSQKTNLLMLADHELKESHKPIDTPGTFLQQANMSQSQHEGIFIKWHGRGIIINPSKGFLKKMHSESLGIFDFNYIICTKDNPHIVKEIEHILTFKDRANKALHLDHEIKVLHLHQKSDTSSNKYLHSSLPISSTKPAIENLRLSESIELFYFTPYLPFRQEEGFLENSPSRAAVPGVTLKLTSEDGMTSTTVGILPEGPFSSFFSDYYRGCQLLIADTGSMSDMLPLDTPLPGNNSLGYSGLLQLAQEFPSSICFSYHTDKTSQLFSFEAIKDLRREIKNKTGQDPLLFPSSSPTVIDLDRLYLRCQLSGNFIAPEKVQLISSPFPNKELSFVHENLVM